MLKKPPTAQLPLFGQDAQALAKSADPATSHVAAADLAADSARLGQLQHAALQMVAGKPDCTASELAKHYMLRDPRQVGRRLSELEKAGKIVRGNPRTCRVTGKKAHIWSVR